jgi:hypothetical protein
MRALLTGGTDPGRRLQSRSMAKQFDTITIEQVAVPRPGMVVPGRFVSRRIRRA